MSSPALREANYPLQWEADVVLRNGDMAHIRPITPGDTDAITQFHSQQSKESIYFRFFAPLPKISDADLHRFTHVDHHDRVALVVYRRGALLGIGRFDRLPDSRTAEVAFNVADSAQGLGVGSILLEHLGAVADELGVTRFVADVLPQNRKMQRVFADAGYTASQHMEDGVITVTVNLSATERSHDVRLAREHRAESLSMEALFSPGSVAVLCEDLADADQAQAVLEGIIRAGFGGDTQVLTAEPDDAEEVVLPCDVLVVWKPLASLETLRAVLRSRPIRIVVMTAPPADPAPEWTRELVALVRSNGARLIGPGSAGVALAGDTTRLVVGLGLEPQAQTGIGVFCHRPGSTAFVAEELLARGLAPKWLVSVGERADVSGNDIMQWCIGDASTTACLLSLDTVGNPRKFVRIARELARLKPTVAHLAGASLQVKGVTAADRDARRTRRAVLRQTGLIPASSMADAAALVTMAAAFHETAPATLAVATIGLVSMPDVLALTSAVARTLPVVAQVAVHTAEELTEAVKAESVAAGTVVLVITAATDPVERVRCARAVAALLHRGHLALLVSPLGAFGLPRGEVPAGLPVCASMEEALDHLDLIARWHAGRGGERSPVCVRDDVDRMAVQRILANILSEDPPGRVLRQEEAHAVLEAYGITVWPYTEVCSPEEAAAAIDPSAGPHVLRVLGADGISLVSGSVRGNLRTPEQAKEAFIHIQSLMAEYRHGPFVVQPQAPVGVPTMMATREDPLSGPLVSFGLAGPASDILEDVAYRIAPLTRQDVEALIDDIRASTLLRETPEHGLVDHEALREIIVRLGLLADHHPQLAQVTLLPVNARAGGCDVLGAHIAVAPSLGRRDRGVRVVV